MPKWLSLPAEVRCLILEYLTLHEIIAPYAIVSEEWKKVIQKKNFAHLKLSVSCLDDLEKIGDERRGFIRHIWLNIELKQYTCRVCHKFESVTWFLENDRIIRTAITRLFFILADWKRKGNLVLELNAYSPSDSQHWFKNCYFGAPGEDKFDIQLFDSSAHHDPKHGWFEGRTTQAPCDNALRRTFEPSELQFQEDLPSIPTVTKFVVRRQFRRQINPLAFSYIWKKLPRLQEIVYEPWQLHEGVSQLPWDTSYWKMINHRLPAAVKSLTIFEDFNENYLELFQLARIHRLAYLNPPRIRVPSPALGAAFAARSRRLEHLSVAFMIDACEFLSASQPNWQWDHLKTLTLTSRKMAKANRLQTNTFLQDAARVALRMPELETLTLWNGEKNEASSFTYSREAGSISWQGTWDLKLEFETINAWKVVSYKYSRKEFSVKTRILGEDIGSHGDAIHYLGLHSVVDDVSLKQIREENKLSWI